MKCFNLYIHCTGYPTDPSVNMLCISNSYIASWYPKEDNMTSCFNGSMLGYYLDTSNIYKNCNPACESCTYKETDTSMFCNKCTYGYYNKVDNMTSCFKYEVPQYFFDGIL
jgi:hypothetical protein